MINILTKETIDKIAAGEVIERPLNVVKELLENSIDSGADTVSLEIKGSGSSLIRVTDNGSGIEKDDIRLAFMRHATSKLRDSDDLMHISSFGFRGEALASISGVSRVELITKRREELYGYNYRIEGGEERHFGEIGAPDGTTMIVRDLFYNVPARRKFLKSLSTEAAHIEDIVEKTALSHPEISVRLVSEGRSLIHTSGNGSLRDVIYTVFGREVSENLIELDFKEGKTSLTGYIGKPVISRSKRDFELIFVNERFVRSSIISKALEEAFKPFMMQHRFPFAVLRLDISPEEVDVNVHPQKMEVRFSDTNKVYDMVQRAVRDALSEKELISEDVFSERPSRASGTAKKGEHPEPFELRRTEAEALPVPPVAESASSRYRASCGEQIELFERRTPAEDKTVLPVNIPGSKTEKENVAVSEPGTRYSAVLKGAEESGNKAFGETEDRFVSPKALPELKIVGSVFDTYQIVEYRDKMYIIDQHAAHEKVLYEKTVGELRDREPQSQMIYPPIVLELNSLEAGLVEKHEEIFTSLGFELERGSGNDFVVRAVPANLYSIAERELLKEIVDSLGEEGAGSPDIIRDRIASMSCKAAVKAHDRLSEREVEELLRELFSLENPYACPHGRPTIISMSRYELEKKFKRIV